MRKFLLALDDQSAKQLPPSQASVRCFTFRDSYLYLGGALSKQGMEDPGGSQVAEEPHRVFACCPGRCSRDLSRQMRSMPRRNRKRRRIRCGHVLPSTSKPDRRQEDEHRHRRRTFLRNQRGKKTDALVQEKTDGRPALATRAAGAVFLRSASHASRSVNQIPKAKRRTKKNGPAIADPFAFLFVSFASRS